MNQRNQRINFKIKPILREGFGFRAVDVEATVREYKHRGGWGFPLYSEEADTRYPFPYFLRLKKNFRNSLTFFPLMGERWTSNLAREIFKLGISNNPHRFERVDFSDHYFYCSNECVRTINDRISNINKEREELAMEINKNKEEIIKEAERRVHYYKSNIKSEIFDIIWQKYHKKGFERDYFRIESLESGLFGEA